MRRFLWLERATGACPLGAAAIFAVVETDSFCPPSANTEAFTQATPVLFGVSDVRFYCP